MSRGPSIKRLLKRGSQHIAANLGPHRRVPKTPSLLILMYHRVLPRDDSRYSLEEPGMLVTPETLENNITEIKRLFEIVSLTDWIEARQAGQALPEKACAITFDDGWADNYEFAFPVLQKLRTPATIFLVSDMIGSQLAFWPERLARLACTISSQAPEQWAHPDLAWLKTAETDFSFGSQPPNTEQISQLVASAKALPDAEIHNRLNNVLEALDLVEDSSSAPLLNWSQVQEMIASGLIQFGSHTCHHTRLNEGLPPDQLRNEIGASKIQIEQHINRPVETFCFPNGDYSPQALSLVRELYQSAVTTTPGWNTTDSDAHLLKRIGIHNDIACDRTAFLARISGWL